MICKILSGRTKSFQNAHVTGCQNTGLLAVNHGKNGDTLSQTNRLAANPDGRLP
jgi:hypothetical protein